MQESKSEVRKRILAARCCLSEKEVIEKSNIILDKIVKSDAFNQAGMVMCYMDFRNEVKTGGIINEALSAGKRMALPLVYKCGEDRRLLAFEIKDLCRDVQAGIWGILEPCSQKLRQLDESEIDLVIVPGVAFDVQKQRLGYGAGYYDRFFQKLKPGCMKLAVAFDIQVLDAIPVEAHDVKMDSIITETRII